MCVRVCACVCVCVYLHICLYVYYYNYYNFSMYLGGLSDGLGSSISSTPEDQSKVFSVVVYDFCTVLIDTNRSLSYSLYIIF